jgi:hypothetical protein
MPRIIRGNRIHFAEVPTDPTWTDVDQARFCTLNARFPEASRDMLQCWVWKMKVPGLQYDGTVETALSKMKG